MSEAKNRTKRMTRVEAVTAASRKALGDEKVVLLGETVGKMGGAYVTSVGFLSEFGSSKVIDLPISSTGTLGLSIGMAIGGKRPIVEVSGPERVHAMAEQLLSELGGLSARTESAFSAPVVIRVPVGSGESAHQQITSSSTSILTAIKGVTVVSPSTPAEAAGMLLSATKASGPVVIVEPLSAWGQRGEVDLSPTPLTGAKRIKDGGDLVIITWGAGVAKAITAAESAAIDGLEVGVIDLRNLSEIDLSVAGEAITATGMALVLHDDQAFADGLVATLTNHSFLSLEAPIGTHPAWRNKESLLDAINSILNF